MPLRSPSALLRAVPKARAVPESRSCQHYPLAVHRTPFDQQQRTDVLVCVVVVDPGVALSLHSHVKHAVRGYLLQSTNSLSTAVIERAGGASAAERTSSMWSRKGMPVLASHLPVPSRFRVTLTLVSLVRRSTEATRSAAGQIPHCASSSAELLLKQSSGTPLMTAGTAAWWRAGASEVRTAWQETLLAHLCGLLACACDCLCSCAQGCLPLQLATPWHLACACIWSASWPVRDIFLMVCLWQDGADLRGRAVWCDSVSEPKLYSAASRSLLAPHMHMSGGHVAHAGPHTIALLDKS